MSKTKTFYPSHRYHCVICGKGVSAAKNREQFAFKDGVRANQDLKLECSKETLKEIKDTCEKGMVVRFNIPYCSQECLQEILKRTKDYRVP